MRPPPTHAELRQTSSADGAAMVAHYTVQGRVQGVGFRPWIFRLATSLDLTGEVQNSACGVAITLAGEPEALTKFHLALQYPPDQIEIESIQLQQKSPANLTHPFQIRASTCETSIAGAPPLDTVTCGDCLAELSDPENRRFRFPYISCAACGPRYSLVRTLPFDRERTTMHELPMCPDCTAEYEDPANRRYHAQTISCSTCGPQSRLWLRDQDALAGEVAIESTIRTLQAGQIVAIKGLGGYQLLCDAASDAAVSRLRALKQRPRKPFAIMLESITAASRMLDLSTLELSTLSGFAGPIVLGRPRAMATDLTARVAPYGAHLLGVMLPPTGLHHILAAEFGFPLVVTSANRPDEPIIFEDRVMQQWFAADRRIAAVLTHNRSIEHPIDDAIMRDVAGIITTLRLGRGISPLNIHIPIPGSAQGTSTPAIAFGADLKSSFALRRGEFIYVSPYLGTLNSVAAIDRLRKESQAIPSARIAQSIASWVDSHPDSLTTLAASDTGPTRRVPHHLAHVLSCAAEQKIAPPFIGVAWDGLGIGDDGGFWGGETLFVDTENWTRIVSILPLQLVGGDLAAKQPWRSALAVCAQALPEWKDLDILQQCDLQQEPKAEAVLRAIREQKGVSISSMGRLFDAIAWLLGKRAESAYEGEMSMWLEGLASTATTLDCEPCTVLTNEKWVEMDWRPLVRWLINSHRLAVNVHQMARTFHRAIVQGLFTCLEANQPQMSHLPLIISGGCMQNSLLVEEFEVEAARRGVTLVRHHRIPANDGGIALGQITAALHYGSQVCV